MAIQGREVYYLQDYRVKINLEKTQIQPLRRGLKYTPFLVLGLDTLFNNKKKLRLCTLKLKLRNPSLNSRSQAFSLHFS